MPILVEIQCDRQDERARGKNPCASRCNRNPSATAERPQEAHAKAKIVASGEGWHRRMLRHDGARMGWICPPCQAFAAGDAADQPTAHLGDI